MEQTSLYIFIAMDIVKERWFTVNYWSCFALGSGIQESQIDKFTCFGEQQK